MAKARIRDIEMYYEVHGPTSRPAAEAETLVLIMGLGANAASWEMQIPDFSRDFRVLAFDNRGCGRTDKPPLPYSIPQMADDTAGLMDYLGIESAHVYGMSMGGMIAQELALAHPARVRSLVLGGTMPGGPHAVMAGPELIQQWAASALLPLEQAIENGLRFLYSERFLASNRKRLVKRALDLSYLQPPMHSLQKQFVAVMQFNTYDRLKHIKAPTLVVCGTEDKIVPPQNSRVLAENIPGAELLELEGVGHGFLGETPDEANSAVLAFLHRHARTPHN